jgi:tRNA nucleotidyltransferase (CCA-adding enzyme)
MHSNVASQMKSYLPESAYSLLVYIGKEAHKAGQDAYIVGGIVRDMFLNRPVTDIDIAVEADALKLSRIVAAQGAVLIREHARFGTATISINSFSIDMASTRNEWYTRPGSLPSTRPGTITEDLKRRDFSINAIAVCITSNKFGLLVDPFCGRNDIRNKLIKVLHDRSFIDDPTRIFRAIRYQQRLHFSFESETEKLVKRDMQRIDCISGDRIRRELGLFFLEDKPENMLERAYKLGVLTVLHPALKETGFWTRTMGLARSSFKQNIKTINWCLFLYTVTHDESRSIAIRLNLPLSIASAVYDTQLLKARLPLLNTANILPSDIDAIVNKYSIPAIQTNMLATEELNVRGNLILYLSKLRYVKCSLNGNDLLTMGVSSGPIIGDLLTKIRKARLNGTVNTKKQEMEMVYSEYPALRKKGRK